MKALLSISSDAKTVKGEKYGYLTGILYLAPSDVSGYQVCAMANLAGCADPCLYYAGRGAYSNVQASRIRKTQLFFNDRKSFLQQLNSDIEKLCFKAEKASLIPAVRLNGTSDIDFTRPIYGAVPQSHPDVQFYDYTKHANRKPLPNYHLTWSYSTSKRYLRHGLPDDKNWACVFNVKSEKDLPDVWLDRMVVNGDQSDLRFLDPTECVVGLKAKGRGRSLVNPLVINLSSQ